MIAEWIIIFPHNKLTAWQCFIGVVWIDTVTCYYTVSFKIGVMNIEVTIVRIFRIKCQTQKTLFKSRSTYFITDIQKVRLVFAICINDPDLTCLLNYK